MQHHLRQGSYVSACSGVAIVAAVEVKQAVWAVSQCRHHDAQLFTDYYYFLKHTLVILAWGTAASSMHPPMLLAAVNGWQLLTLLVQHFNKAQQSMPKVKYVSTREYPPSNHHGPGKS